MSEFFHMGGYAAYVWTSYGIALVVLLANLVLPWLRRRRLVTELARRERRARRER